MKSAMFLFLMPVLLTGCFPALTSPIEITKKDISRASPDIMSMPSAQQKQAGHEILGGKCPALNDVANLCLVTLDEARALK